MFGEEAHEVPWVCAQDIKSDMHVRADHGRRQDDQYVPGRPPAREGLIVH